MFKSKSRWSIKSPRDFEFATSWQYQLFNSENLIFQRIDYRTIFPTIVHEIVNHKYNHNNTITVSYWNTLQQQVRMQKKYNPDNCPLQLGCCGYSGPVDWAYSSYNGYQANSKEMGVNADYRGSFSFLIPSSCCR